MEGLCLTAETALQISLMLQHTMAATELRTMHHISTRDIIMTHNITQMTGINSHETGSSRIGISTVVLGMVTGLGEMI